MQLTREVSVYPVVTNPAIAVRHIFHPPENFLDIRLGININLL
jgi:hypothetical protein